MEISDWICLHPPYRKVDLYLKVRLLHGKIGIYPIVDVLLFLCFAASFLTPVSCCSSSALPNVDHRDGASLPKLRIDGDSIRVKRTFSEKVPLYSLVCHSLFFFLYFCLCRFSWFRTLFCFFCFRLPISWTGRGKRLGGCRIFFFFLECQKEAQQQDDSMRSCDLIVYF